MTKSTRALLTIAILMGAFSFHSDSANAQSPTYYANVRIVNQTNQTIEIDWGWHGGEWKRMSIPPNNAREFSYPKAPYATTAPWFVFGVYDKVWGHRLNYHVASAHSLTTGKSDSRYTRVYIQQNQNGNVWAVVNKCVIRGGWHTSRVGLSGWYRYTD